MSDFFMIDQRLRMLALRAEGKSAVRFQHISETAAQNGEKVLAAFIRNGVSERHFNASTGYGYGDEGREKLDRVFADIVGAEDAIIRHSFASGTHTLAVALFGVLRPGDRMISVTGGPYDTLHGVIGLKGEAGSGSLLDFGVKYEEIGLTAQGKPDLPAIAESARGAKMVYIQRSRGYSLRPSLTVGQIGEIVRVVKEVDPSVIVMVDNCYGEFVETMEPTEVGADLMAGSLIKNPGGGIAPTGGYIAGRRDLVELCAGRMTAPGVGREIGASLGHNRELYMGLFFAPQTVENALKTACLATTLFSLLGYTCYPAEDEPLADIVAAIRLGTPERLIAFCRGIQSGAPVDASAVPEPWDMPGYDSQVIMAAGAFTLGASIELSADAPLREPYAVWLQGGLTYPTGRIGVLLAAQAMLDAGLLDEIS